MSEIAYLLEMPVKMLRTFQYAETANTSVIPIALDQAITVREDAMNKDRSIIKFALLGIPVDKLISVLKFDTDKIICNFIFALLYLFVALEEVDYQILAASKKSLSNTLVDDLYWPLPSMFFQNKP